MPDFLKTLKDLEVCIADNKSPANHFKRLEAIGEIAKMMPEIVARFEKMDKAVLLFPEAHDTLTNQEMRDTKGNFRSLVDQQTNALKTMRGLLHDAN